MTDQIQEIRIADNQNGALLPYKTPEVFLCSLKQEVRGGGTTAPTENSSAAPGYLFIS